MRRFISLLVVFVLFWLTVTAAPPPAHAQSDEQCLQTVRQALTLTKDSCDGTGRNQACYGNITLKAEPQPDVTDFSFESQGDIVDVDRIRTLELSTLNEATNEWGVAWMQLQANLPDDETDKNVTVLLFGQVGIRSADAGAEGAGKVPVEAAVNINVRYGPDTNSGVNGTITLGDPALAVARLADTDWVNVRFTQKDAETGEETELNGWVQASQLDSEDGLDAVRTVTKEELGALYAEQQQESYKPLQAFFVETGVNDAPCPAAPDSGLLVQTPEGVAEINLLINEVDIRLHSTAYIQAQASGDMIVNIIEGEGRISAFGITQTARQCTRVRIPLDNNLRAIAPPSSVEQCEDSRLQNLPIDILKRPIKPAPSLPIVDAPLNPAVLAADVNPTAAVGEPLRVRLNVEGTIGECPAQEILPLDVVLVIDVSGSMEGEGLAAAKSSAIGFINRLNPDTDQVAVVIFSDDASVLHGMGQDFAGAQSAIAGLETEGGTQIDAGLNVGYGELQASGREGAQKSLILLSDGGSDRSSALAAADQLHQAGMQLITVGVGGADTNLLSELAGSPDDMLSSPVVADLSELFTEAAFRLTRPVAARSLNVTYRVNSEYFEVLEDTVSPTGSVENGVIQWSTPLLHDGQTRTFEFAVRPLSAGDAPVGAVDIAYLECLDGGIVQLDPQALPEVNISQASDGSSNAEDTGILTPGADVSGELITGENPRWLLNIPQGEQAYSLVIDGAGASSPPRLSNAQSSVAPLYSVQDTPQGTVAVYRVNEPGLYWASLQSSSPDDQGSYNLQLVDKILFDPPLLTADALTDEQNGGGRVYTIDGEPGSLVTVTYTGESSSLGSMRVISADGVYGSQIYYKSDYSDSIASSLPYDDFQQVIQLYALQGEPPYTLYVTAHGKYELKVNQGDTLRVDKGTAAIGDSISDTSDSASNVLAYTLEDAEPGQTITLKLAMTNSEDYSYPTLSLRGEGNSYLDENVRMSVNNSVAIVYTLPFYGPYAIYLEDVSGGYTLSIEDSDTLTLDGGSLAPGERKTGGVTGTQVPVYALDAEPGALVSIQLDMANQDQYPTINVYASGNDYINRTASTSNSGAAISVYQLSGTPPYQIRLEGIVGNYTIRVEEGDILRVDMGELALGQTIEGTSPDANKVLTYTLDAQPGQTVSITSSNMEGYFSVYDAQGSYLSYTSSVYGYDSAEQTQVFTLEGIAPFTIQISSETGSYSLGAVEGDAVSTDMGELALGQTVEGTSPDSGRVLLYTLDAQTGQTVSIRAENLDGYMSLYDSANSYIDAQASLYDYNTGAQTSVFRLTGAPPYKLHIDNESGSYTLSVTEGDASIVQKPALTIGATIRDQLNYGERGSHPLEVEAGETVVINLTSDNYYPVGDAYLVDGSGKQTLLTERTDRDNGTSFTVTPSGDPPYALLIQVEGTYRLAVVGEIDLDGAISVVLVGGSANLRTGPGTNYDVAGSVAQSDALYALGRSEADDWLRVVTADQNVAWVFRELVTPANEGDDLSTLPVMSPEGLIVGAGEAPAELESNPSATESPAVDVTPTETSVTASASCTISAPGGGNRRAEPSTGAALAGTLAAGETAEGVGQTTAADGFVWWLLNDGSWVRSDVVDELTDCSALPQAG